MLSQVHFAFHIDKPVAKSTHPLGGHFKRFPNKLC